MLNKKIIDFYAKYGHSLKGVGISGSVIQLALVPKFFVVCQKEQLLVLGGDVYIKRHKFITTNDNWYYEGDNVLESIETARRYLNRLTENGLYICFVV